MASKPIATVGDVIAYMLDRGHETVSVSPMLHSFCGISQAVRQAAIMKLITTRFSQYGEMFITWNV